MRARAQARGPHDQQTPVPCPRVLLTYSSPELPEFLGRLDVCVSGVRVCDCDCDPHGSRPPYLLSTYYLPTNLTYLDPVSLPPVPSHAQQPDHCSPSDIASSRVAGRAHSFACRHRRAYRRAVLCNHSCACSPCAHTHTSTHTPPRSPSRAPAPGLEQPRQQQQQQKQKQKQQQHPTLHSTTYTTCTTSRACAVVVLPALSVPGPDAPPLPPPKPDLAFVRCDTLLAQGLDWSGLGRSRPFFIFLVIFYFLFARAG